MFIFSLVDKSKLQSDHDVIPPWYQSLIDLCQQSHHCRAAYLASLVAKCITLDTTGNLVRVTGLDSPSSAQAKDPDADTLSCSSEPVSPLHSPVTEDISVKPEVEAWNQLVKQTEDLVMLGCLLKLYPERCNRRPNSEPVSVCVAKLLDGGKGKISHASIKP